ncbi:three-Cys-motif partner protein TcmP [Micromonospora sp. NPDC000207]|uniref:three-Cys-motif partner protein TcmP n=1 Tax=Micromonospora sp. NPDC000207 TaxID=3154246 RepID=UPI003329EED7
MSVGGTVPWPCAPHTVVKHDIYQRYLERWFPILLQGPRRYSSVTYAEGFSGPGIYSGGEDGSPVIAIRALVTKVPPATGVVRFAFLDNDERCVNMLWDSLRSAFPERPRTETAMPVVVREGTCANDLERVLDEMKAWGKPIFANLDSWGNAPVPFRLLQRLAANVSSEVMVTLSPQHFVRFVSKKGAAADDVFGGDPRWRTVTNLAPEAKSRHILACYRQGLRTAGFPYLLDFELVPKHGQPLYLIFGTGHPFGVEKMKESLWEVDRTQGVGFRDPRDEQAETLFVVDEPQLTPLTRQLHQKLRDGGPARVEELRQFTLLETVYRPQHVLRALKPLVDQGAIEVEGGGALRIASVVSSPPPSSR